jgi:hypothetical protein
MLFGILKTLLTYKHPRNIEDIEFKWVKQVITMFPMFLCGYNKKARAFKLPFEKLREQSK